jgi:excisionase family DNA binding protein
MPTQITGITFYTVQETAKELRVSTQSVRNYIKQGKLKARRVGKFIMITEIDIRKFLNL